MILNKCADQLEKTKDYKLSVLVYCLLIYSRTKKYKRSKWWYRLALDLKHLGMYCESFCICYKALKDDETIWNSKRNALVLIIPPIRTQINFMYEKKDKEIKILHNKTQLKTFSKRMSMSTYKAKVAEIESKFDEKIKFIKLLNIEHFFNEKSRKSFAVNKYRKSGLSSLRFMEQRLEEGYNHTYFRKRHILCRRALNLDGSNVGARYIDNKGRVYGVEELALKYYTTKFEYTGIHAENNLGITFFGLLMWDVIFDDSVPAVFQSAYQFAPLDYGSTEFYWNREKQIIKRLSEISLMSPIELKIEVKLLWDKYK